MTWLKKNLIFTIIMVLLIGVLGYEIYLILGDRKTAIAAEEEFGGKIEEYQKLSSQPILPHERNVQLTQDEIERQLAEMRIYEQELGASEELKERFADHPTSSTNALFDVQFFVEEYRQKTAAATQMSPDSLQNEFFGFQAYAQTGPEEGLIPSVYKQRLIVAYILDRLFEAEPEALLSVARPGEEGAGGGGGGARGETQAGSAGFRLDSKFSAAIPEIAQTSPYQVTFTGRTSTLRAFINSLAEYEMPLIVRSIQVGPASGGDSQSASGESTRRRRRAPDATSETATQETEQPDENIPLVADNLSRFTVAMEFIELVPFNAQ